MQIKSLFKSWQAQAANLPSYLKQELVAIENDQQAIDDRFYQYVPFGTGGMRGLLGVGTNRMNIFTIRRVAFGLAKSIVHYSEDAKNRGVVISYDSRHYSYEFALETAKVLGEQGMKTFVFAEPRPTPELSFAIRHLHAYAGVMITASHNPKEYNGFKVYGEDGAQLTPTHADQIVHIMENMDDIFAIKAASIEELQQKGLYTEILEDIDMAFQQNLQTISERTNIDKDLSIVYTPLHGVGYVPVMQGLTNAGFTNIHVVKEQTIQDGDFPTVVYPNPEEPETFRLAMVLGKKTSADLLLATDPDSDRLGVAVRNHNGYQLLTGNQVGALVTDYLIKTKKEKDTLPCNAVLVKTIVTSELGAKIAKHHRIHTINTLTGFKYIAEQIEQFEKKNTYSYLFGYEESYGYLVKSYVRDKDAVQMAVLIAEMAGYFALEGRTLLEALEDLYQTYGYHREALVAKVYEGQSGQRQITTIMENFRQHLSSIIAGVHVLCVEDYLTSKAIFADGHTETLTLPTENVLKFKLEDDSWIAVRPSGTEPKCKYYFGVVGETAAIAEKKLEVLKKAFEAIH
ncbi:phospho-sugar mutase [Rummeliibacillus suwonensis]|uniref:phospho-sugar mutase n=1 Tax=Rummeliibacillus suwonensis TaxID=1306154 RepID=UPI001AB0056F|nr:phospho-sugar mutase [Rummeliibacillus suwonensis]MBO2534280.1 phospho-sugar mutase [Rummeliibacillus suwonensis]